MTDFLDRLGALDTCAVSDALDALRLPAAVAGIAPLTVAARIVGPVLTVKLGAHRPPGGSSVHLGTRAIEAAGPGDIIVVEQLTGIACAAWGGVLSIGAQQRGVAGVIVEGAARDIDEVSAAGFPLFARAATAVTARGRVYEQDFNTPILVGGVSVHPQDYVMADRSAVVFIPQARLAEVIATAESIAQRERLMVQDLRAGKAITTIMGTDYETMLGTQD